MGLNVDKTTAWIFQTTTKAVRENFSKSVKDEFDNSDVSCDIERGVKKFFGVAGVGQIGNLYLHGGSTARESLHCTESGR